MSILPLATAAERSGIPSTTLAGAGTIGAWCIDAPVLATANVVSPAFSVAGALMNISPIVTATAPAAAVVVDPASAPAAGLAAASAPLGIGAPLVCRMPAAPLTM